MLQLRGSAATSRTPLIERLRGVPRRMMGLATMMLLTTCRSEPTSVEGLGGLYVLEKVNGATLPYDNGPVPPRPGIDTTCHVLLPSGQLVIDGNSRTYELSYNLMESCSGRSLGSSGSIGTVSRSGSSLAFVSRIGEGKTETSSGVLRGRELVLQYRFYLFLFSRQLASQAPFGRS